MVDILVYLSFCWERSIWNCGIVVCRGERDCYVGGECFEIDSGVDEW